MVDVSVSIVLLSVSAVLLLLWSLWLQHEEVAALKTATVVLQSTKCNEKTPHTPTMPARSKLFSDDWCRAMCKESCCTFTSRSFRNDCE